MPLIDSPYSLYIWELLQTLDHDCLSSLALTATKKKLSTSNRLDAIHTILRYTNDLTRFFAYKKITSQVLFKYLNTKNICGSVDDNKEELTRKVKQYWESRVDSSVSANVSTEAIFQQLSASFNLPASASFNLPASASFNLRAPSDPNVSLEEIFQQFGVSANLRAPPDSNVSLEEPFQQLGASANLPAPPDPNVSLEEPFQQLGASANLPAPPDPNVSLEEPFQQLGASANLPAPPDPNVSLEEPFQQLGASANLPAPSDPNVSANNPFTSPQFGVSSSSSGHLPTNLQGQYNTGERSDVFSIEFCRWFYSALDNLQGTHPTGETLSVHKFMPNSTIDIHVLTDGLNTDDHASGQCNVFLLLKDKCTNFNLSFEPNLYTGLQAKMSEHGLLKLYCVGTVHEGDALVGKFEQEFRLAKSPERKWKIKATKITMEPMAPGNEVPSLPNVPVFYIPL